MANSFRMQAVIATIFEGKGPGPFLELRSAANSHNDASVHEPASYNEVIGQLPAKQPSQMASYDQACVTRKGDD